MRGNHDRDHDRRSRRRDDASARPIRRAPPTRFREPTDNESVRFAWYRRLLRLPRPREEHVARFRDTLYDGDPRADALARHLHARPREAGYRLLERAIKDGVSSLSSPPAPLVELFAELDQRPAWVDDQKLELAARVASRVGMSGERVLSCICLTGGYRSAAANKPLVFTGALESRAYRRLAETSKFVVELYETPRLTRDSAGFRAAVMVRMMHAMVRQRLTRDPRWREQDWGAPLNQADQLSTSLLFSTVSTLGLRALGHVVTRREADAVVHFWRYVGVIMGITPRLLPRDFAEACALAYVAGTTQPPGDADSRRLAAALLDVPVHPDLPPALVQLDKRWRAGFSRLLLGDQEADELGLPNSPWKWMVLVSVLLNLTSEAGRLLIPGAEPYIIRARRALVRHTVERSLRGVPPSYRVSSS